MNFEFHYYITHLIAAKAGFRGDDLRTLAYASQFTDDNNTVYSVRRVGALDYKNQISQTMQPLRSHQGRLEVYPLFHFIPGDSNAESAWRKDGRTNPFNTTPNSPNANRIIDAALGTNDFYQIGIATHAYVDTWAHQNFVGYQNDFNAFSRFVDAIIPNIGHADAKTMPDQPRLIWDDERLAQSTVNNKRRFLDAAGHLFEKLRRLADSSCSPQTLNTDRAGLLGDLDSAMSGDSSEILPGKERIAGYSALAERNDYSGEGIPGYDEHLWFKEAVKKTARRTGNPSHGQRTVQTFNFIPEYESSDWFKFQKAVKVYADRTKAILCETPEIAAEYTA